MENIENRDNGYPVWVTAMFFVEAFRQCQNGKCVGQYEPK